MPTYDFRCKDCGETFEVLCKISEMDDPRPCKHCGSDNTEKFIGGAPGLGDSASLGLVKPPAGFRDVLKNIAERNPHSTLKETSRYL